jgi:hypothetical protein
MRRSLPTLIVVVLGGLLLVDFVVVNPALSALADILLELLVLLAAGAALAGAIALVVRHWGTLAGQGGERGGAGAVLAGMGLMLVAGFYPGSRGAADPAVAWLVAALLAPLIASIFALLFFFLLRAARGSMALRMREATVMLVAAGVAVVLLLPLGGALGDWLAAAAGWTLLVPVGGVFRGLLIGVAIVTAVQAVRIILAVDTGE